jgi:hypothetical protein
MFILFSADDENDQVVKELSFDHMPTVDELCNYIARDADIDIEAVVANSLLGKGWHDGDHTLYHIVEVTEEVNTEWRPDNA